MSAEYRSMKWPDRRLRRAAAWRIRLQYSDFTTKLHERWEAWIDVSENERAFDEIEALWNTFDALLARRQRDALQVDFAPKSRKSLASLLYEAALRIDLVRKRAIWITANVAALAIGAVVLFSQVAPATTLLQVQVDPRQGTTPEQASTMETAPLTDIEVSFNRQQRIVQVSRGKAVFRVAKDPQRSIVVTTGPVRIEGMGSEFSVSNTELSVVVTVNKGIVEISPSGAETGAVVTLHKNYRWILPKNGSASTVQKVAALDLAGQ